MSRSDTEDTTFAKEGGHWYTKEGEPAYEVPNLSRGGMRPTTIKDARKLNLLPSVSGILKIMGKGDALTNWCKRQVAVAAYDLGGPGEQESKDEYVLHLLESAEKNMTSQRDKGTRDHGAVEGYFHCVAEADRVVGARFDSIYDDCLPVQSVMSAFHQLGFRGQRIASEKSFAHPMGYGGKIDVSGEDEVWIVDFKFVDRLEKKKDYVEKVAQGSAYLVGRYGIGGLKGRFANIFVETNTYGYEVREWSEEEIMHGWNVFESCFKLWKIINKYEPV